MNFGFRSPIPFVRPNIASKTVLIAVFWSRNGILSIIPRGRDQVFDRNFFLHNVMGDLSRVRSLRRSILHFDNVRPHLVNDELKQLGVTRKDRLPYSPDLASNGFLSLWILRELEGMMFQTEDEVLEKVKSIILSIPKEVFRKVYDEWILQLKAMRII